MSSPDPTTPKSTGLPDGFEARLRQRAAIKKNPLSTVPVNDAHAPLGNIPNTPLAASIISFLLGAVFSPALIVFVLGAFQVYPWAYYQLGFFVAAWAAFHWGEFAVTAGWNLEKCSVDCMLYFIYLDEKHLLISQTRSIPSGQW